ncbi:PACE efflux transporter [Uliginosibacterium sp. H3]|uniref:PACE efflux transporter n=1 Tax=Uliginosibacterium silvisoli TaxID=3114758 RepID=A0ABU6K2N9_9RHOO|nr:PACE efflux transporter [Uliginosibacterium sp. H3]
MQGKQRKVVHAVLFELFAVISVTLAFMATTQHGVGRSGSLAIATSLVAMSWNMAYNVLFEKWEARQTKRGRSLKRRIIHSIGFEAGLVVLLLPLVMWWLDLGLWPALTLEFGLVVFFVVYGLVFNWCFDHIFGLPNSAKPR